jgi:hypothetical protein
MDKVLGLFSHGNGNFHNILIIMSHQCIISGKWWTKKLFQIFLKKLTYSMQSDPYKLANVTPSEI